MSNFSGTPGNDTLTGTSGNDNLDGGQGADTLSGLEGNDVYMVDDAGDVVIEAANQGIDRVNSTISYTLGPNVEDLWLVGSLAISGTGNALDNVMWGNAADNSLTGLDGNDVLDGGAGADTLTGGAGDDSYWVDNIGDVAIELPGQGTDTVKSTLANYTLGANFENLLLLSGAGNINGTGNELGNVLTGNEGDNALVGLAGNDTLDGGAGADTLTGGSGDDTCYVDNVGDVVIEQAGEGTDTIISTASSYTLSVNVENLTLGTFAASLENLNGHGNELDNTLRGNSGANILTGGAGDDTLIGGSGNDTLTGGAGNDLFYFSTEDTGSDTITDLASGDVIEICGALFLEGDATSGNGATLVSGQVQLEAVGGQTLLRVGVDATPGADLTIRLDGAFDPGNFHLSGFNIRYDTNHAPSLIVPIPDQSATQGAAFSLQLPSGTFSDIDGDTLTYSATVVDPDWGYLPLPAWLSFNAATQTFHGTPGSVDAGDLFLAIVATDPHEATNSSTFRLSVSLHQEPQNHSPDGSLTISGNPAQGQVLTAINNVLDADGLGTMHYQWQSAGVNIAGATGSTFMLTQAEVGTTITVLVSYTDGIGTEESVSSGPTGRVVDLTGPLVSTFSPGDEASSVGVGSNVAFTFDEPVQWGSGNIILKTAAGSTVASYSAASNANLSLSGNTLTINPSSDLGIFTSYRVEIPAGAIRDMAGNNCAGVNNYNFSTQSLDSLYHFCVVAFSAAPGVEYMSQLADAYNTGSSVRQIVNVFTTKPQFTSTYPESMTNADFASLLVANVVRNSASASTKADAVRDITGALDAGWTRGDMIYQVFGNLAAMSLSDAAWGNTALQFQNQTAVAKYFTETLHNTTTDLPTLRAVIGSVDSHTDVSTPAHIATLIGVELGHPV